MTSIIGDPLITCVLNAHVARESHRPDIARIWEICEHLARGTYLTDNGFRCSPPNCGLKNACLQYCKAHLPFHKKWKLHPIAKGMLNQIILRLIQGTLIDFQTAAMIICAFTPNRKLERKSR